ncbi:MAG: hypothetical protein ACI9Y7_000438 [Dokdonia sp.]|jgi:hypothetical protein
MYKKGLLLISNICFICFVCFFIYSCKTKSEELVTTQNNTVIIDLKESVTPEQIMTDFNTISLKQEKKISNALNIHLFSFDENKIPINTLLLKLKESDIVDNAQSNKKTNARN